LYLKKACTNIEIGIFENTVWRLIEENDIRKMGIVSPWI